MGGAISSALKVASRHVENGLQSVGSGLSKLAYSQSLETIRNFLEWYVEHAVCETEANGSSNNKQLIGLVQQVANCLTLSDPNETANDGQKKYIAIVSDDGGLREHIAAEVMRFNKKNEETPLVLPIFETIQGALDKLTPEIAGDCATPNKIKILVSGGLYEGPLTLAADHADITIASRFDDSCPVIATDSPSPLITISGRNSKLRLEGLKLVQKNDGRSGVATGTPIIFVEDAACVRWHSPEPIVEVKRCTLNNYGDSCVRVGKGSNNLEHLVKVSGDSSLVNGSSLHGDDAVAAAAVAGGGGLWGLASYGKLTVAGLKAVITKVSGAGVAHGLAPLLPAVAPVAATAGPLLVGAGLVYGAAAHWDQLPGIARSKPRQDDKSRAAGQTPQTAG